MRAIKAFIWLIYWAGSAFFGLIWGFEGWLGWSAVYFMFLYTLGMVLD